MRNKQIIFIHILIALLTAFLFYFSFKPLWNGEASSLMIDAALSGIILSFLLLLVRYTIRYSNFSNIFLYQHIINIGALGLFFSVLWMINEYFLLYLILSEKEFNLFIPFIPLRILIAMLFYSISAFVYIHLYEKEKNKKIELIVEDSLEKEIESNSSNTEPKEILERITVKNGQKIDIINVNEIIHIQAEGDYVMIFSEKGKFLKEQTMKSLENSLPADSFVRVHRSNIVNIIYIAQVEFYEKQTQLLKLTNGIQIKMSLSGYKNLKIALGL